MTHTLLPEARAILGDVVLDFALLCTPNGSEEGEVKAWLSVMKDRAARMPQVLSIAAFAIAAKLAPFPAKMRWVLR